MVIKNAKSTCITLLTITFLLFLMLSLISGLKTGAEYSSLLSLEHRWTISKNNGTPTEISISNYNFSTLKKDDILTISRKLPVLSETFPVLVVKTKNCRIQAESAGKVLYSKETEIKAGDYFINWDTHLIPLSNVATGSVITITFTAQTDKPFTKLPTPYICPAANYTENIMRDNMLPFFLICFLFLFGVISATVSVVSLLLKIKLFKLFSVSLFAFFSSIFLFTKYDFGQMFGFSLRFINDIDFFSRWLGTISFVFAVYMHFFNSIAQRKSINLTLAAISAISLFAICTYSSKLIPVPILMTIWNFSSRIFILIVLFFAGYYFLKLPFNSSVMAASSIVIILISFIDFFKYLIFRSIYGPRVLFTYTNTTIAFTFFTAISLLNYFFNRHTIVYPAQIQVSNKKSIPFDFLTKTRSRAGILEMLEQNDSSQTPYSLLTFSFIPSKSNSSDPANIQKQLVFLAKLIDSFFELCGTTGRINDTQFVVVLREQTESTVQELISTFQRNMDEANSHSLFPVKTLIGWANSAETSPSTYEAVYNLAEERKREFTSDDEPEKSSDTVLKTVDKI
ncbi:MAG: hypothetical protein J6T84_01735 [Spirochaetaceae bacterium]|nr:hypothetical protein [Spirochaetaceae bacterium]